MKIDRHATIDSLCYNDRLIIQEWGRVIYNVLKMGLARNDVSHVMMVHLNSFFHLKFDVFGCIWIHKLIIKWIKKTPDRKQQAEAIAFAIFKQREIK